jgi:hypothetical protein
MLRDRRLVREKSIRVRLTEYENRDFQRYVDLTGDHEATALLKLAMERLDQIREQKEFNAMAAA